MIKGRKPFFNTKKNQALKNGLVMRFSRGRPGACACDLGNGLVKPFFEATRNGLVMRFFCRCASAEKFTKTLPKKLFTNKKIYDIIILKRRDSDFYEKDL